MTRFNTDPARLFGALHSFAYAASAVLASLRLVTGVCAQPAVSGIDASSSQDSEIVPAHPYRQVAVARGEIELIRLEKGKPAGSGGGIRIEGASPREVFYQALTMLRKADRLAFEHTRERVEMPPQPAGEIQPADVLRVVDLALERIRRVKEFLGIRETTEAPPMALETRPSDVFIALLKANRELNQILDRQFTPGDVFQEVTRAIALTSRLLDSFGATASPPDPPAFERRKRPADVYRRMTGCYEKIRRIGQLSGIAMLSREASPEFVDQALPGDVYDFAALLIAELTHLHRQLPDAAAPRNVYDPGQKLPSHVYQRVGILNVQLDQLLTLVEANPNWLKNSHAPAPSKN